ncbi:MAG TPA: hypothetical protein VEX15_12375 [Nocardioidaceae bacterium]|nr:hypothetical protein [Nocardioidaceae bacterium]
MQHTDTIARVQSHPAYGQPPGYELPPGPEALPYAPLPKRRGAGPTVALVVVALAIPGLIAGIATVAGGGNGDGSGGSDAGGTEEVAGPTIEGDGYAYAVPEGWEDRTSWARDIAPDGGDSAVGVSDPDHGFDTNVLVAAWDADGVTSIEKAQDAWLPAGVSVEQLEPTSIDGVEAVGVRHETNSDADRPIVQLGYLALRDGQLYSIVLSAPVQSEGDSEAAFSAVLDSWSWADGGDVATAADLSP